MEGLGRLKFFGRGSEEVDDRAAEGRNRPPLVADQIEVAGHGKVHDF